MISLFLEFLCRDVMLILCGQNLGVMILIERKIGGLEPDGTENPLRFLDGIFTTFSAMFGVWLASFSILCRWDQSC
jgi:hypothetical protein